MKRQTLILATLVFICLCQSGIELRAQLGPAAPAFSSRPGAAHTLYLNFSGFSFTGSWGGQTPGVTPAYNGQTGSSFNVTEQANIKNIWGRISEAYALFNVNVTTVDPAAAAGQAGTYLARQNYYDATPRVMHTVIGDGASTFFGSAGGVSFVNVWSGGPKGGGLGTNWVFVNRLGGANAFHNIYTASSHEIGHAAGLSHQGDYIGASQVNDYSTNNGSTSLAPIMGVGYGASRNTWREGRVSTNTGVIQDDIQTILSSNPGLGLVNDGIGRTLALATPLALTGANTIDFTLAKGVIVPVLASNPNPIGVDNYTKGLFSITTTGPLSALSVTVNAGGQWITSGVATPDATLDASLRILDSLGNALFTSATASLSESLSVNLAAGSYFIEVSSAGGKFSSLGPAGTWQSASFFDAGSYFLTGSLITSIPEPGSAGLLIGLIMIPLMRRRTRSCITH